jgi:RNA polymerase sigma-70 factor (ECF subfamily)
VDAPHDHELMLRYQAGEPASFGALYERYRRPLYRYFARQVDAMFVDDLFQDTWLRVIRAKTTYRAGAPFQAYIFRIAHNVLVDHYRRNAHPASPTATDDLDPIDETPGPEANARAAELRAAFATALRSLPNEQRETFLLHEDAGLTLEQIAGIVGTGRETVKSRLRYAVKRLRKALGEQHEDREAQQ